MVLKPIHLKAIFFLTLGWFGVEMAGALDSVQFQLLIGHYVSDAKTIGLVLCLGPLAGIFQPIMGSVADILVNRGLSRQIMLQFSVLTMALSIVCLAFEWNFASLVAAIAFFYIGLNLVIVNYRALISEVGSRQALTFFKGTITGFIGLFTGLGGLSMYLLNSLAKESTSAIVASTIVLIGVFAFLFIFVPKAKLSLSDENGTGQNMSDYKALLTPRHLLFYVLPFLNLNASYEAKIAPTHAKKAIFRLFSVVFMLWFGIGAMRYFFVLFATKQLHMSVSEASIALCAFTLSMMLVAVPLGKLGDRVDNRLLLKITAGLYCVATLLAYFLVQNLATAILMMAILGVAFAGNMMLPLAMLFRLCPARSEGTYLGLYNLFLCTAQIASLLLTGWLIDAVGDYRLILLVGGTAMGTAVFFATRLIDTQTNESSVEAFVENTSMDKTSLSVSC